MITSLRAKNFKSWRDTKDLRFAPLTGLFGSNSSGKTSILQILLLMKQTVESPDRKRVLHTGDDRSLVDLGTFFDIMYAHQSGEPLEISVSWGLAQPIRIVDPEREDEVLFEASALSFTTTVKAEAERAVVQSFRYDFGNHQFGMKRRENGPDASKERYELDTGSYFAKRVPGRAWLKEVLLPLRKNSVGLFDG